MNKQSKIFAFVLTLLLSFSIALTPVNAKTTHAHKTVAATSKTIVYVGSSQSDKYHYQSCRWAKKIKSEHLVKFNSTQEAQNNGYVPCKVCKP